MAADLLTTIRAEIDARMRELRPLLAEYEELLSVAEALAADAERQARTTPAPPGRSAATTHSSSTPARKVRTLLRGRPPAGRGRRSIAPAEQAILAALEHGSHTVAELAVVTALPAPDIRNDLRPLLALQAVVKTERDGRTAYALPASAPA